MFTRILVPLDGSERAERAVPVAARLARAAGGRVLLVRVVGDLVLYGPQPAPAFAEARMAEERAEAAAYLDGVARRAELAGVTSEAAVRQGAAAAEILAAAERARADLLVVCGHGRTGAVRWALGSVAQKLVRHSPAPVLVLRAEGPIPAHAHQDADRPLRALVGLDGSPFAEAALPAAAELVAALAAPAAGALHLARVLDPSYIGTERGERVLMDRDARAAALEGARAYLREMAARCERGELGRLDLQVTWSVIEEVDAAAALLALAEGSEDVAGAGAFGRCDLIAVASHGRGGVRLWMLGSVADRVLHATRLPLLVVRPPRVAGGEDAPGERLLERVEDAAGPEMAGWPDLA